MNQTLVFFAAVVILSVSFGTVTAETDKRPYCCCVGDGTGNYVCEPNKGECKCGCPLINCKPPK